MKKDIRASNNSDKKDKSKKSEKATMKRGEENLNKFKQNKKNKKRIDSYLKDKTKAENLFSEAQKRSGSKNNDYIRAIKEKLHLIISISRDYLNGNYKEIPFVSIALVLGAIAYFVSPIDVIPDVLPLLGFSDDAAVIAFVLSQIDADLEKYKLWKSNATVNDT